MLIKVCFPRVSFYRQRSIEGPAVSMSRISSSSDEVGHEASIYAFFYFARLFSCFQPRPELTQSLSSSHSTFFRKNLGFGNTGVHDRRCRRRHHPLRGTCLSFSFSTSSVVVPPPTTTSLILLRDALVLIRRFFTIFTTHSR